jgi:hypothetical protein
MITSEAFWVLSSTALKVYMVFLMKRVMGKVKVGRREVWAVINNGEITYTFAEAKKNHDISKSSFLRARDRLIEVGFIEIAEDGGTHHTTKYSISQNWRKYPEESFARSKSANLVGRKTRWIKDTVDNDTI